MKIAVYGDSFAVSKQELDSSWYSLLGKKLNCQVDSYGEDGSSVYTAYKTFLRTYESYDLIIFLVTTPDRYPIKVDFSFASMYVSGLNQIQWMRDTIKIMDATDNAILNDIECWYKANPNAYMIDMRDMILEKVERLSNKSVIVPCFSCIPRFKETENFNITLLDLFDRQLDLLKIKSHSDTYGKENLNIISCHLTPEFNDFFATAVYNRILTGSWDLSGYTEVQLKHDRGYYYE